MIVREATISDLSWFVQAGDAFASRAGLSFDPDSYADQVLEWIESDAVIKYVYGMPASGHCAAHIGPSLFDASELWVKVFSTWGHGGLQCFTEVENQARERGATTILADSWLDPRICAFYRRRGYEPSDQVFMRRL